MKPSPTRVASRHLQGAAMNLYDEIKKLRDNLQDQKTRGVEAIQKRMIAVFQREKIAARPTRPSGARHIPHGGYTPYVTFAFRIEPAFPADDDTLDSIFMRLFDSTAELEPLSPGKWHAEFEF